MKAIPFRWNKSRQLLYFLFMRQKHKFYINFIQFFVLIILRKKRVSQIQSNYKNKKKSINTQEVSFQYSYLLFGSLIKLFWKVMQLLEFEQNQDVIQASIDICLHLTYFRNLTENKLGPLQIIIQVTSGEEIIAIPYQIISRKTYKSDSKIDLDSYKSPFYVLHPFENSIIDEMVIFKIHVPVDQAETGKLKILIALQTVNELAFQVQDENKRLDQVELNYTSILYIDSFLPCLFQSYGISLQGNIFTHLLSCKYGNLNGIYRHHFYQAIDHMVICYNKLRQKSFTLNKIKQQQERNYEDEDLPLFIDMKKYQEYEEIKNFIEKRIFHEHSMKEHKLVLHKFIEIFIPQMAQKLLILWKYFLSQITISMSDVSKNLFYQRLAIELKKRIQYKALKLNIGARSEFRNKEIVFNNQISRNSHSSSLTRSQVSQKCAFSQNQVAQNELRQSFHDKKFNNPYKKLNILNLDFNYPTLKVFADKLIKQNEIQNENIPQQPHIVILVHGLGASSNAFSQFQINLKNIYGDHLFLLNSTCNQNTTDENIQQMGRRLSIQVHQFIVQGNFGEKFQLSFIGHSLGGLILRSALPRLQIFKFNMKSLITLSTPHLGYFYHNSNINKAGMWAISKFSDNQIMNHLLMSDKQNPKIDEQTTYRNSYLYTLSLTQGLGWFEQVMLCGSQNDYFVSPLSAFISTKQSIQKKKDLKSKIWEEMRFNIQQSLRHSNIYRLLVEFNEETNTNLKDQILGRKSHIQYLSSQEFITYILLVYRNFFI